MAIIPIINNLRVVPRDSEFLNRKLGSRGEIYFDQDNNTLRVYDGSTSGGTSLAKVDLSNVSNSVFSAKATAAGVGGGGGNTTVTVGSSSPSSPENGNLWLNTNNGVLYVYINDGDSNQWIQPAFDTFSGDYDDLTNKPTIPTTVSSLTNDAGYISINDGTINLSVIGDDSTTIIDVATSNVNTYTLSQVSATDGQALVWNNSNSRWEPADVAADTGNFTFTGSVVDTNDSSSITFTPAVTLQSDLTVENELFTDKAQITELVITGGITTQGSGTPEIVSDNEINLIAGTKITLNGFTELYSSSEVLTAISGATGIIEHNLELSAVFNHVSLAGDFTANFTNVPTTNNRTISVALILNQGATPYIPTAVQIGGASQTIEWQGGGAPSGTANQTDIVSFTLVRYNSTWLVIGSLTTYA